MEENIKRQVETTRDFLNLAGDMIEGCNQVSLEPVSIVTVKRLEVDIDDLLAELGQSGILVPAHKIAIRNGMMRSFWFGAVVGARITQCMEHEKEVPRVLYEVLEKFQHQQNIDPGILQALLGNRSMSSPEDEMIRRGLVEK